MFLKKIQTHKRFKRALISPTKTQSANFRGNPLYQATKQQPTVKQWKKKKNEMRSWITDLFLLELCCFVAWWRGVAQTFAVTTVTRVTGSCHVQGFEGFVMWTRSLSCEPALHVLQGGCHSHPGLRGGDLRAVVSSLRWTGCWHPQESESGVCVPSPCRSPHGESFCPVSQRSWMQPKLVLQGGAVATGA